MTRAVTISTKHSSSPLLASCVLRHVVACSQVLSPIMTMRSPPKVACQALHTILPKFKILLEKGSSSFSSQCLAPMLVCERVVRVRGATDYAEGVWMAMVMAMVMAMAWVHGLLWSMQVTCLKMVTVKIVNDLAYDTVRSRAVCPGTPFR